MTVKHSATVYLKVSHATAASINTLYCHHSLYCFAIGEAFIEPSLWPSNSPEMKDLICAFVLQLYIFKGRQWYFWVIWCILYKLTLPPSTDKKDALQSLLNKSIYPFLGTICAYTSFYGTLGDYKTIQSSHESSSAFSKIYKRSGANSTGLRCCKRSQLGGSEPQTNLFSILLRAKSEKLIDSFVLWEDKIGTLFISLNLREPKVVWCYAPI